MTEASLDSQVMQSCICMCIYVSSFFSLKRCAFWGVLETKKSGKFVIRKEKITSEQQA